MNNLGRKSSLSSIFSFYGDGYSILPFHPEGSRLDSGETVYISSLALLKILKHARSGVPLEVMGLLLGVIVDDYTIEISDVFSMPQSGGATAVESTNEEFQAQMFDMLQRTGLDPKTTCVGWYHSHPGYGNWLSKVDMSTHEIFQSLHDRCLAMVIDPVQSVKGKVLLDLFRLVSPTCFQLSIEFRNVTGNIGITDSNSMDTKKQILRGLNRNYYKLNYKYRMSQHDRHMLMKTMGIPALEPLRLPMTSTHNKENVELMKSLLVNTKSYLKELEDENVNGRKETKLGAANALHHMCSISESLLQRNFLQNMGLSSNCLTFQAGINHLIFYVITNYWKALGVIRMWNLRPCLPFGVDIHYFLLLGIFDETCDDLLYVLEFVTLYKFLNVCHFFSSTISAALSFLPLGVEV